MAPIAFKNFVKYCIMFRPMMQIGLEKPCFGLHLYSLLNKNKNPRFAFLENVETVIA